MLVFILIYIIGFILSFISCVVLIKIDGGIVKLSSIPIFIWLSIASWLFLFFVFPMLMLIILFEKYDRDLF